MACASAFSYDGFKLLRLRENSVTDTALLRLVHDAKNDDHARLIDSDKRQVYLPPGKAGERLLKRLVRLQIYFPKKIVSRGFCPFRKWKVFSTMLFLKMLVQPIARRGRQLRGGRLSLKSKGRPTGLLTSTFSISILTRKLSSIWLTWQMNIQRLLSLRALDWHLRDMIRYVLIRDKWVSEGCEHSYWVVLLRLSSKSVQVFVGKIQLCGLILVRKIQEVVS